MSAVVHTLRLFGVAVLMWTVTEDDAETSPGDCTTYPLGFTPSPPDQRWERGPELTRGGPMPNAYALQSLPELGIKISDLGCVMLAVESRFRVADLLPEEWAYRSPNADLRHVSGIQQAHHTTLLFGLLPQVRRRHVDEVLTGWDSAAGVAMDMLSVFDSPLPDEPYSCIVARASEPSPVLLDAHARLSMLPHINTHPTYKPHVTLAYVRREVTEDALAELRSAFGGEVLTFTATGLDYGDVIGRDNR